LEPLGVHVQTVPEFEQLVTGTASVADIQEVDVCDLLGRDSVPPKPGLFEACIRERVVMVTGAGGSIGSELCRQIIGLGPKRLVLFEMSELALYNIERELRSFAEQHSLTVELVGLIGNAHHRFRLRDILSAYRVQTVYHAAAYKHVPIVEQNVIEGIYNNVIATWYAAEAAHEAEVETFVLVSTDKAVNPTNVMGATKRVAEQALQALARGYPVRASAVRFGNVLGSTGSVVPLFERQIAAGGPLTVTDPAIERYFMTVEEAAALVLQAASLPRDADGGSIFVLDMGDPVRIDDLARQMIRLHGLRPDEDVNIVYTGLRPGEKLYEEVFYSAETVSPTAADGVLCAVEVLPAWEALEPQIESLARAAERRDDGEAIARLRALVPAFRRS
jgi:FlaA1/EpsC-like NDP-sugar epimerase